MLITILNVSVTTQPTKTGKSYQVADVAYKNLTFQGKVEGKKVMSFGGGAEAFKIVSQAQPGETYEVTVVKNPQGYNDWTAMVKGDANQTSPTPEPSGVKAVATKSTYETAEERAQRQVLIVRQSSLSSAVATLAVGSKAVKPEDVVAVAKQYEDYVFGKAALASGFEDMTDDIPL